MEFFPILTLHTRNSSCRCCESIAVQVEDCAVGHAMQRHPMGQYQNRPTRIISAIIRSQHRTRTCPSILYLTRPINTYQNEKAAENIPVVNAFRDHANCSAI